MRIIPVLTEKSLDQAKEGNYTFWVDRRLNKNQIRNLVEETFGVHVTRVRTINVRGETRKKATVALKEKEKINLFESKKK